MSFGDALDVLYEDNHVVAVNKPCGWPSAHFSGEKETTQRVRKASLKKKSPKPGTVSLGFVPGLNTPVSGILVFPRNSRAAAGRSPQFRDTSIENPFGGVGDDGRAGKPRGPPL